MSRPQIKHFSLHTRCYGIRELRYYESRQSEWPGRSGGNNMWYRQMSAFCKLCWILGTERG